MPTLPLKACSHPGCGATTAGRFCENHLKTHRRAMDARRGSAASRGYGGAWRRARRAYLARQENALCRECEKRGVVEAATDVDHVIPHRGDRALFWDESNWQPLCGTCHKRKTVAEGLNLRPTRRLDG